MKLHISPLQQLLVTTIDLKVMHGKSRSGTRWCPFGLWIQQWKPRVHCHLAPFAHSGAVSSQHFTRVPLNPCRTRYPSVKTARRYLQPSLTTIHSRDRRTMHMYSIGKNDQKSKQIMCICFDFAFVLILFWFCIMKKTWFAYPPLKGRGAGSVTVTSLRTDQNKH